MRLRFNDCRPKEDLPLFDRPKTLPVVHHDDPLTSCVAADKMIKSGQIDGWHRRILNCMTLHDCPEGLTAKEIAFYLAAANMAEIYFKVSKRMKELQTKGEIYSCCQRDSVIGGGFMRAWRIKI